MDEVIIALDGIRKDYDSEINVGGMILGEEWLAKIKIKKCLIAARLTKKVIAIAVQEKVKLIITIYPPLFTRGSYYKINKEHLELLKKIIQNKIAIYSLTKEWLVTEKGGFDYFLQLLDFEYNSKITCENEPPENKGRLGRRKKKLLLKDMLELLRQNSDDDIRYLGYSEMPIQEIAVFSEITDEIDVYWLQNRSEIDLVIVGDISYEALLVAKLIQLPVVVLGRRNLENVTLGNISRRLMEEITITLPELITVKQDKIGTVLDD
ncbi:MAG: Nif3-like dinuclear metal center hexameric protein [Cyanobacteriota bacterium]|nr:Nif3-like dinuclear metal center hexameric protein [Cyanobacteriota bacterium]